MTLQLRLSIAVASVLCLSSLISAQSTSGVVTGRTTDRAGAVLQGARVNLEPGGQSTVTNNQGEFKFLNVDAGAQKLTVSFVGFAPYSSDINVAAGQTTRADATLEVSGKTEELLVTADRPHGEAEAINRQRTAENILQVLPAEVITSLPNANVADALGRLPSVTLERDEGEGKYVQIRGTEPRYSNVTVDGVNVASPENVRQIKLDIIPSDLVESVEINKTLLASGDGDAIGGSVNLRTKSAGEQPTLSIFGLGGYNPIINGVHNSQYGVTAGKRFGSAKKLGILFGATYDYNGRGIDDLEPSPQTTTCSPGNCANPGANAADFANYSGPGLREYRYDRSRWGFGGTFDYKFSDSANIYAHLLYSHFNNFGDRWEYNLGVNSFTTSALQGGPDGSASFDAQIRRPVQTIGNLALGGQNYAGRSVFTWELSGARASTEDKGYTTSNFGPIDDNSPLNNVVYRIDVSNPYRPKFPVQNGVNIYDTKQYFLQNLDYNKTYSPQLNLQAGASYAYNYRLGSHFGVFEVGGKFRNAHKFQEANDIYYNANDPASLPFDRFSNTFRNNDYYGNSYQYGPTVDYNKILAVFRGTPGAFSVNQSRTFSRNTPQTYDLVERVSAGYFQNSISFGRFRFYTGLRFEGTDEGIRGTLVEGTNAIPVKRQSGYIDPLPSIQVKYTLSTDSSLRLAYGRGVARPNFSDLVPGGTITDTRNRISAGNLDLKSTYANNYDLLYERYLNPLGIITAGFFYKDIQQPIYSVSSPVTSGTFAGYTQVGPVNGTNAKLYGFEFGQPTRILPAHFHRGLALESVTRRPLKASEIQFAKRVLRPKRHPDMTDAFGA